MKSLWNRRTFLKSLGTVPIAGPALSLSSRAESALPSWGSSPKSRVVVAQRQGILKPDNTLEPKLLNQLLDMSLCALGDRKVPGEVWRSLFSATDTVGIKINGLGGRMLSPHPELVYAIADRLAEAGVPRNRIFIWERSERELKAAGFDAAGSQGRAVILATDSRGVGYESQPEMSGTIGSCFSRIVSQACTALINVGVLKDHDLSGVSIGMKNLFGLIHNPNRYHFDVYKDPYLPDLCLHRYVKDKLRLTICDGFRGQYDGGPAFKPEKTWEFGRLLISTDVVAIDAVGARILEKKRQENGLKSFKQAGREPLYLQLAEEKRIGWADAARIEVKEVTV